MRRGLLACSCVIRALAACAAAVESAPVKISAAMPADQPYRRLDRDRCMRVA